MTEAGRGSYLKVVGKTFGVIEAMAKGRAHARLTGLAPHLRQPQVGVYRKVFRPMNYLPVSHVREIGLMLSRGTKTISAWPPIADLRRRVQSCPCAAKFR